MQVTTIGTGYVGLVTGACLAEMGDHVVCLDVDADRIRRLARGELPIHRPGLPEVVCRNARAGRLCVTTDADSAADLHGVEAAARTVGQPRPRRRARMRC